MGLGHSAVVSFSPLAAVALLLLFGLVWFMPNSMELMWRHRPGPALALCRPAGETGARSCPGGPRRCNAAVYGLLCIVAVLALSNLKPFIYFQF